MSRGEHTKHAETQLAKVLGPEKAGKIVETSLVQAGLSDVSNAQQLLDFAQALISHGGFVEVVGRTLKVRALLAGARLPS